MIELKLTGMCEDCQYADIKLRVDALGVKGSKWVAFCTHDVACLRINAINQEKEDRDGSDCQKKEESDEEKINKERACRILERRKMCVDKAGNNDVCPDDCSLCKFCVTDKTLASALEYAINYLKEESDEVHY